MVYFEISFCLTTSSKSCNLVPHYTSFYFEIEKRKYGGISIALSCEINLFLWYVYLSSLFCQLLAIHLGLSILAPPFWVFFRTSPPKGLLILILIDCYLLRRDCVMPDCHSRTFFYFNIIIVEAVTCAKFLAPVFFCSFFFVAVSFLWFWLRHLCYTFFRLNLQLFMWCCRFPSRL